MLLALLLAVGAATTDGAPPSPGPVEPDTAHRAILHAALEAFGGAFRAGDADALDSLLADDYVHTNGGSGTVLDKRQWLDYVRQRGLDLEQGRLRVDRYDTSNVVVRWHPAAAVVSSQVTSEGVQSGRAFVSRLQVTQIWVWQANRWRRAAFHDSPLPTR